MALDDPRPWKKSPGFRILCGLLLLFLGAWGGLFWAQERGWTLMREHVRARVEELDSRDYHRSPLRGEALPGNAWADYQEANRLRKPLGGLYPFDAWQSGREFLDRESLQARLEPVLPLLELVRRGSRREESRIPLNLSNVLSPAVHWTLVPPALLHARFLAEEGNARAAVELLLDFGQACLDSGQGSGSFEMFISCSQLQRILSELLALLSAGLIDPELLPTLDRELELLDRRYPLFREGVLNDVANTGSRMLAAGSVDRFLSEMGLNEGQAWRGLLSGKPVLIHAFTVERDVADRLARAAASSWAETRSVAKELSDDIDRIWNPLLRTAWLKGSKPDYEFIPKAFHQGQAQLRLCRAAVYFLLHGRVPELDDPFDGKIRWRRSKQVLTLWSRGRDGVDDGGRGGWDPKLGRDIVLEVRR